MDITTKKRKADELGIDAHEDERRQQHFKFEQNGYTNDAKDESGRLKTTTTADENHQQQQPASVVPFDRLIVFHVEATCDENLTNPAAIQVTKENSEIIDLSFVVLDTSTMQVVHEEKIAVRPERTPLTNFCTAITNITWDQLSSAGTFKDAIRKFDQYVQEEILSRDMTFCFVTHGGWILRIQMAREAMDKNLELPEYLSMYQMFDLKQEVQRWQMQHHPEISLRTTSLTDLCEAFHIERGSAADVGLDSALTVAKVVRHLTSFRHPDVFTKPIHFGADLQRFKNEESKVVRLAGLPYELTQGELEAWFSSNGLRPATTWMIQTTEHSKPSLSGFVLFQSHDEALRALRLNGRCLGDRPIEVAPSNECVIEQAAGLLTPFPVQANNRRLRPGDWMCPNCSFHNFASRRNCFKCNAESPHNNSTNNNGGSSSTKTTATPGGKASNFTPGDWLCPNTTCQFHNYSSRYQCWKCGTDRPTATAAASSGAANDKTNDSTSTPTTPTGPAAGTAGVVPGNTPIAPVTHPTPIVPSRHSVRPGDWFCPNSECCFQNFASRTACYRCHTPNPHTPSYPQQSYNYTDPTGATAVGGATGTPSPYPSAQYRAGDWICTACSTHNFASRQQCLFCSAGRTSMSPSAMPTGISTSVKPGDWICQSEGCGFHNFAKRTHCARCGAPSDPSMAIAMDSWC
ncbi:hypothetical protein BDB00DRAFT_800301 [Zychaea mexicana]|uniref:uncharacterized protein n=1 Tax=Zychaea mexicana TaxID=64656 RepID=UPI0022FDFAA3|nr:uncharacterized protein BDB00DRAFT_800301 [Zychaea mexicana]KAI9498440.1 hypothetical protein BDB00DRAFT_800301 [Zychaea mexicana]